jgi:KDO2-lipid IV(A) lauroyltransferase
LRVGFATFAGEIYYWAARDHSRKADENIRRVLGETCVNRRVRHIARRSFRNYAKYMTELLRNPYLPAQEVQRLVVDGRWDSLKEVMEEQKGVMCLTVHFGNWDIGGNLITSRGFKVAVVANDFSPPDLNELVQGVRRQRGITVYSSGERDTVRRLFEALDRNELVGLVLDSPSRNEGVIVDFFGAPARFPKGPAAIALKKGVKVVVGFLARQPGDTTYYGVWTEPLEYTLTGNREHDIQHLTQLIAYEVEKFVHRHPDQWYMFRQLWLNEVELSEYRQHQREGISEKQAAHRIKQAKQPTSVK